MLWSLSCALTLECAGAASPLDRDLCRYRRASAASASEAHAELAAVEDPVVRGAGVITWIRAHPDAPAADAWPLCSLLVGGERKACERKLSSAHLRR